MQKSQFPSAVGENSVEMPPLASSFLDWDHSVNLTLTAGDQPNGMAIGDVNNDGDNDLVTCNYATDDLSIFLWNRTSGTWDSEFIVPVGTVNSDPSSVAIGDVNDDGFNDIVTTLGSDDNISILTWNRTIESWNPEQTRYGWDYPTGVTIGDANNDGKNDIISTNANAYPGISILTWNQASQDWDSYKRNISTSWMYGPSVGDVNNDGFNDLVAVDNKGGPFPPYGNSVYIWLWNTTSGTWDSEISKIVSGDISRPRSSAVGDANNDGMNEIVTANFNHDNVSILVWNSTLGDWEEITKACGDGPYNALIADANNDGQNDIVTANYYSASISILTWNVTSSDWNEQVLRVTPNSPVESIVADVNNDGELDIGVVSTSYDVTIWFWNATTPSSWNEIQLKNMGITTRSVTIADANNDGQNDIIATDYNNNTVSILIWNTTSFNWNPYITRNVCLHPDELAVGDVDNDGDNDIVVTSETYPNATVLIWNQTIKNWDAPLTLTTGNNPTDVVIADANEDGYNDIVAANMDNVIGIYVWNSSTMTWNPPINIIRGETPYNMFVGDANNDGQNDILTSNIFRNNVSVSFWNKTLGTWDEEVNLTSGNWPTDVYVADANNDGLNEVLTINRGGANYLSIFSWNFTSNSWDSPITKPLNSWPESVCSADVNNDGYLDILVSDRTEKNISIFLWNNNTSDWDAPIEVYTDVDAWKVVVGDANNDGQNDFVSTRGSSVAIFTWIRVLNTTMNPFGPDTSDATVDISWNAVDGASMYYIYRDTSIIMDLSGLMPVGSSTSLSYVDKPPTTGNYFYAVVASDGFTRSSVSNSDNVSVDALPPSAANFTYPSMHETNTAANITVQIIDDISVSTVLIHINDTEDFGVQNVTMNKNVTHYWYTYTPMYDDAWRNVTIYMNDTSGNINRSSYLIKDILFSPPTYSTLLYPTTMANGTVNVIELRGVRDNTNLATPNPANISINKGTNITMIKTGDGIYRYSYTPLLSGSNFNFSIYIFDEFGNVNYTTRYFDVIVDVNPPTWSNLVIPEVVQGSLLTISIDVTDNTAIKQVLMFIPGDDFPGLGSNVSLTQSGSTYQYSFQPSITGLRSYTIYIEDIAGNWNSTTGTFYITKPSSDANPVLDFIVRYLLFPLISAAGLSVLGILYSKAIKPSIRRGKVLKTLKAKSKVNIVELKDNVGLESSQIMKITDFLRESDKIKGCWNREHVTFYTEDEIKKIIQYKAKKQNWELDNLKVNSELLMELDFPEEEKEYIQSLIHKVRKTILETLGLSDLIAKVQVAPKTEQSRLEQQEQYGQLISKVMAIDKGALIDIINEFKRVLEGVPEPNMKMLRATEDWMVKIKYYVPENLTEIDASMLVKDLLGWKNLV